MPFIKLSEYTAKKIYSSDWDIRKITRDDIGSDHLEGKCGKYILKVDEFVKRRGKKGLILKDIEINEAIDQFLVEKKEYNNLTAWISVCGLLAMPCLMFQATSTKPDLSITFCFVTWFYALYCYTSSHRKKYRVFPS